MQIKDRLKLVQLLAIYQDFRVEKGGTLLLSDLREQWSASGLRGDDLVAALNAGCEWGVLSRERYEGAVAIKMLSSSIPAPAGKSVMARALERGQDFVARRWLKLRRKRGLGVVDKQLTPRQD